MAWLWWPDDYATAAQAASLHGDILKLRADLTAAIATATARINTMSDTLTDQIARIQAQLDGIAAGQATEITAIGALGADMTNIQAAIDALKSAGISPAQASAMAALEASAASARNATATISAALTNVDNIADAMVANVMVNPPPPPPTTEPPPPETNPTNP